MYRAVPRIWAAPVAIQTANDCGDVLARMQRLVGGHNELTARPDTLGTKLKGDTPCSEKMFA